MRSLIDIGAVVGGSGETEGGGIEELARPLAVGGEGAEAMKEEREHRSDSEVLIRERKESDVCSIQRRQVRSPKGKNRVTRGGVRLAQTLGHAAMKRQRAG